MQIGVVHGSPMEDSVVRPKPVGCCSTTHTYKQPIEHRMFRVHLDAVGGCAKKVKNTPCTDQNQTISLGDDYEHFSGALRYFVRAYNAFLFPIAVGRSSCRSVWPWCVHKQRMRTIE